MAPRTEVYEYGQDGSRRWVGWFDFMKAESFREEIESGIGVCSCLSFVKDGSQILWRTASGKFVLQEVNRIPEWDSTVEFVSLHEAQAWLFKTIPSSDSVRTDHWHWMMHCALGGNGLYGEDFEKYRNDVLQAAEKVSLKCRNRLKFVLRQL